MQPWTLTINDKPLLVDMERFALSCVPGVHPARNTFSVAGSQIAEIWPPDNPVSVEWEIETQTPNGLRVDRMRFDNLWITEYDIGGGIGTTPRCRFQLLDQRWKWAGRIVHGRFNHPRRLNDFDIIRAGDTINVPGQTQTTTAGGFAPVEPITIKTEGGQIVVTGIARRDVIGDNLAVPRHAYWKLTTRNGEPWTALELVRGIIHGYAARDLGTGELVFWKGLVDDADWGGEVGVEDNKFAVNRIDWRGMDARTALAQCMADARVRCAVFPDGKLYLFPLDVLDLDEFMPDDWNSKRIDGSGQLYFKDLTMVRPEAVHIYYAREQEFRFRLITDPTATTAGQDPAVVNVIKLQTNESMDLGDGPREYAAGTLVPVDKYLDAIGIEESWLRSVWFSPGIVEHYASLNGRATFPSVEDYKRIGALKSDYRQLFMLSEQWRERLVDVRAETVTQLDAISGRREPTPVWVYFFTVRNARCLPGGIESRKSVPMYEVTKYENTDGIPDEGEDPGPFVATVEDPILGVFRIRPGQDMKGIAMLFELGDIESNTGGALPDLLIGDNAVNLTNCRLTDDFACCLTLTVMVGDPNHIGQCYKVTITPEQVGSFPGNGGPVEKFVTDETARFDYNGDLVNQRMVFNRADAEARHIYRSWRDRWCGSVSFGGLHEVYPFGPVNSVTWELVPTERGAFCRTVVDCAEPIPPKSAEHLMPAELRHAMNRMLPPQD